jgi:homoserine O-acetyltransferase
MRITFEEVLYLESGRMISPVSVDYETYGELSPGKDNAILLCHALTGSARALGTKENPGWWDPMVGPGKAFDTGRYFVICSNILGSCYGTTGPSSIDPYTGEPYALRFPVVTIKDMVKLQKRLIEHLGIERLYCVAGGSLGGMQALSWAVTFPELTERMIAISTARQITPMAIAFNTVARYAITKDPHFCDGNYYDKTPPKNGLAIGRMAGHITYLSDAAFNRKFGRRYATFEGIYDFNGFFEVENYLRYNGYKFTDRFDANSYLYLLKAMDIFDIEYGYPSFEYTISRISAKTLFLTFTSDYLFPEYQTEDLVNMMIKTGNPPKWVRIDADYGHDSFLLEFDEQTEHIKDFLNS